MAPYSVTVVYGMVPYSVTVVYGMAPYSVTVVYGPGTLLSDRNTHRIFFSFSAELELGVPRDWGHCHNPGCNHPLLIPVALASGSITPSPTQTC